MDVDHPAIVQAISSHEGDSVLYVRLAMCAMDINERCLAVRRDVDRVGMIMASAMLDIEQHLEAQRITRSQRDRLLYLLKENMEEPTVDNDVPVYKLRFPSPDYDPPPRAA